MTKHPEVRVHEAQAREDARALEAGRKPRLITRVEDIRDEPPLVWQPRQVSKPDLVRIARALGLKASEKEPSRQLVERCVEEARQLRRDFELTQKRSR